MGEKHFVKKESGEKIAALSNSGETDQWIFFCHGFADTKERSMQPLAQKFNEEGFNTVVFDFRGNGESSREFDESTLTTRIEDLNAVIDYFDPEECFIYGTSFGSKVGIHAAAVNDRIQKLAVKAPVTYNEIMDKFREVVENKGEAEFYGKTFDERFFDDLDSYSFSEAAEKIDTSVAIFHGAADTTVHPENSFRAAQQLDVDVMLQKFEGEKHSFSDAAENKMVSQIIEWLKQF